MVLNQWTVLSDYKQKLLMHNSDATAQILDNPTSDT